MRRKTISEEILTRMIEAAAINAKTTREEKTEMKEYKCKVELSKEYTITAANPTEARNHAAALFMMEATDENPHELLPAIYVRYADEVDDTEEDDLDWEYEEEEEDASWPYHYRYSEKHFGFKSLVYEFGYEMVAEIAMMYRLTNKEKAELERKVALLNLGDSDTLILPYAEIEVTLSAD